jgi:ubiquinone/menaquinone biosynthesis C-methylase UbiE
MNGGSGMNPAEFANIAAAEQHFWWYRGMRRILFRMLDPVVRPRRVDRVLEVGCGTGYFAGELRQRYGWRVVALDVGFEGLAFGKRLGVTNLVQADMRSLPCRSESFDAVVSMDVIVHLPRDEEAKPMAEFQRVLKPGGLLVVRVSALDILRSRHSEFAHERQRFTRGRLLRVSAEHGFRPIRCTYANAVLMPVALAKFRLWEPLTRQPPASGVATMAGWLDRLLYSALAIESEWLGRGWNLPIGQSIVLVAEKGGC